MKFDRVARHYDWMEALSAGTLLQRARECHLPALVGCRAVLSAGEGHGRFAAACLAAHPQIRVHCLDESPVMLQRARRRIKELTGKGALGGGTGGPLPSERATFEVASLPGWRPIANEPFDAIATCFFLDCFPLAEQAAVIDTLANAAAPRTRWIMVDFAIPPHGWRNVRARVVHALMYAFFRRVTGLHARHWNPPDTSLVHHGFRLVQRRTFNHGLLAAELWER